MPDVVLYTLVALDGATESPRRYFPESRDTRGAPVFDDDLARHETEMIARQGAVLLGRGTYDEWSEYWPTSDDGDVHASITLAKALLAAGLVDELCQAVGRVLDPVGPGLFDELPERTESSLVEAAPTSSGSLWLRYRLGF